MQDLRAELEARLDNPARFPEQRFAGRGIVICAGGQRYFTCAWVLISILRRVYRTTLPIQLWHLGRNELSEAMQRLLEDAKVEVVNAETVLDQYPARIAGAWPLKPYAIAHSRFAEVILLDADSVPLADPGVIFDFELYRESGLLFWPDVVDLRDANPIWSLVGLEPRHCTGFDSGILAIDKKRGWQLLEIAILLNEHWRESYRYLHGDKDTFLIAALLTGARHSTIEHRPFIADGDFIQRDPSGDPLLHHRTASKWKLFGDNSQVAVPALMPHCEQALAELRQRWSGVVFHAPDRSQRAKQEEAELIRLRQFRYVTSPKPRDLELLFGGMIGDGRTELEQHWAIVERGSELRLQFYSGSRLTTELIRQPDGSWRGCSLGEAGCDGLLVASEARQSWPHVNGKPVIRSAEAEINSILDASLFASGLDAGTQHQLEGALALLNRLFDDVPEQVAARLAGISVPQDWRDALEAHVRQLRSARDARSNRLHLDLVTPDSINPHHYSRVF